MSFLPRMLEKRRPARKSRTAGLESAPIGVVPVDFALSKVAASGNEQSQSSQLCLTRHCRDQVSLTKGWLRHFGHESIFFGSEHCMLK
jgi:hypothetical protein